MHELDKTGLEAAEAEFTAYFVKNYPGPNTIINDPRWHAPKLFRAAKHALSVHLKASATTSAGVTEEQTPRVTEIETQQFILKAMARNYSKGHSWDKLDAEACLKAAEEIRTLRAAVEASRVDAPVSQKEAVESIGVVENHGGIRWFNPPVPLGTKLYASPSPAPVGEPAIKALREAVDAPDRLWLSASDYDNEHNVWFDPDEGGTEYVRADLASSTSAGVTEEQTPQFWLAELDPHGNPRLLDGAHRTREGVEKAAYLHMRLGLQKGLTFACAEVHITPVEAAPHGANEEALSILSARNQPHER